MPRHLAACLPLLALLAAPAAGLAADAHTGVHAQKGEMVLLRDVSARTAYRPAPPGIALIVDPTPNRELHATLGTGEISDEEFAQMSSGQQLDTSARGMNMPAQLTSQAINGSLGRATGANGALSGSGIARSVGGATGAVTGATRGIAPTITGALSQFPMTTGNPGTGK